MLAKRWFLCSTATASSTSIRSRTRLLLHLESRRFLSSSSSSSNNNVAIDSWDSSTSITNRLLEHEHEITWSSQEWDEATKSIQFWTLQNTLEGIDMAWKLMDRLVHEECNKHGGWDAQAWNNMVLSIVTSWASCSCPSTNNISAKIVLEKIQSYQTLIPTFSPDICLYNTIIETAIQNNDHNAHDLAEQIIRSLSHRNHHQSTLQQRPNRATYTMAIDALAASGVHDAPQRAEALLQIMTEHDTTTPDANIFSVLIEMWTKSRHTTAPRRAEHLLDKSPAPSTTDFNTVLEAWAKTDNAADQCYKLFQHVKTLNNNIKPDALSYGTVISAFAKAGRTNEAQEVLHELLDEYKNNRDANIIPHRIHFNALLEAWAKSNEKGAAQNAETLLETMQTLAKDCHDMTFFPNVFSFDSVIHAWAKSNEPIAAARAEAMLHQMQTHHEAGVPDVSPTVQTFSMVLDCLAHSRSKHAAMRAEAILEIMMDRFKAGEEHVKPNTISFTTVINAFAKSRDADAALKAEWIYTRMKSFGVIPNKLTFSSLISACANSRDPQGGIKAEGYLSEMKQLYNSGVEDCKPDTITYNAVLHALSTSKDTSASKRALAILDEMALEQSGNTTCAPDVISYTCLLNTVARSASNDKARLARRILSNMEQRSIQPNIRSFNGVIMACAFSSRYDKATRQKAYKIAWEMMERGHDEAKPTAETFSYFFLAAAGLGHDSDVEAIYRLCCRAGVQNDKWLQESLMKAAPHLARK